MARIAFFTERLPSYGDEISLFSSALIRSLADQHHDIRVYTTDDNQEWDHSHSRIEIVRPFQKWSWWETAKLLPLLVVDAPEIIHVIQPRYESVKGFGPSPLSFLAALTSFPSRPKLVISLYEIEKKVLDKLAPVLQSADLVLVRSHLQQTTLVDQFKISQSKTAILPAVSLPIQLSENESAPESLSFLGETAQPFVFVPGGLDQHLDLDDLFKTIELVAVNDENVWFVVEGSWSDLPISKRANWVKKFNETEASRRTILTGKISDSTENFLYRTATAALLATLNPQKLKFWRHSRRALQFGTPFVLSKLQTESDELNWLETELNIVGAQLSEIAKLLVMFLSDEAARASFREQALELADRQVTDLPANHLTRLYLDLLNQR